MNGTALAIFITISLFYLVTLVIVMKALGQCIDAIAGRLDKLNNRLAGLDDRLGQLLADLRRTEA